MKRFISVILLIVFSLTLYISASAESEILSIRYVPRTERGTLFYLDIYSKTDIAAATFALRYDTDAAEYRGVSCEDDNASVLGNAENGTVRLAYCSRSSADGKLYSAAFKALRKGSFRFELSVTQAVDGNLEYITELPACSLDITLAESDVVSSGSSGSGKKASSTEPSTESGGGSELSEYDTDGEAATEPDERAEDMDVRDFSGSDKMMIFWMGAAAALLLCLLILGGVFLAKRLRARRKAPTEEAETEPEEDEDIALYEAFEADQAGDSLPEQPSESPLSDSFRGTK